MADVAAQAPAGKGRVSRSRRTWARKLTPAQIRVVAERYFAGGSIQDLMREFGIGRSSLYRYLEDYKTWPDVTNDATHWRIECQRMKNLVVDLALDNKAHRAEIARLVSQLQKDGT